MTRRLWFFPSAFVGVTLLLSLYLPLGGFELLGHVNLSLAFVASPVFAWIALTVARWVSRQDVGDSEVDLLWRSMISGAAWALLACALGYVIMYVWVAIGFDLGWFPRYRGLK